MGTRVEALIGYTGALGLSAFSAYFTLTEKVRYKIIVGTLIFVASLAATMFQAWLLLKDDER